MNIAEILKARKRTEDVGYVIPIIEEQLMIDALKVNAGRRRDVVHPSEVCDPEFCSREWLLCQKYPDCYKKKKVPAQTQKRFDVGTLLHTYVQEKLGNAGVLFGMWECLRRCDGERCVQVGFKPGKEVCTKSHVLWSYVEPTVHDEDLNLYGNVDGIIVARNRKVTLEFKSMNTDGFSTLVQPVKRDKEQSLWYLDTLIRTGFKEWNVFKDIGADEAYISERQVVMDMPYDGSVLLYMNKNTQEFSEFLNPTSLLKVKEFMVEKDDSVNHILEGKKQILRETLEHHKNNSLPDKLFICDEKTARRARRCLATKYCFA